MSFVEWWNALGLATQIFYCIAIPTTLVLIIQTVMMFFGLDDGDADTDFDFDTDVDADFDMDTDFGALDGDVADIPDTDISDGIFGDDSVFDGHDVAGLDSLRIFTVRGIIAFLVIFGWVGVVMTTADIGLVITLPVAAVCGLAIMVLVAYLFKVVMKLRSDGTADNRNALGGAGKVYLTIPPSRQGEGKVNVMLQGSYVERNAVTDESEAIPTGSEIIVVGISGQTTLVVKRK